MTNEQQFKRVPDEELQAIRDRVEKATPGPWIPYYNGQVDFFGGRDGALMFDGDQWEKEDAEFIAHAREDVPRLLNALEQSYAEIERLRQIRYNATEAHSIIQTRLVEENQRLLEMLKILTTDGVREAIRTVYKCPTLVSEEHWSDVLEAWEKFDEARQALSGGDHDCR